MAILNRLIAINLVTWNEAIRYLSNRDCLTKSSPILHSTEMDW